MKSSKTDVESDPESAFYQRIRTLVLTARQTIARGVDLVQVHTNFEIGRHIVEREQHGEVRAAYGKELLTVLSQRLTAEFGKGFARSNIAYMRNFFLTYRQRATKVQTASGQLPTKAGDGDVTPFQIVQTLSGQSIFRLGWSHYVLLLGIKNPDERDFYEIEAANQGWR